MVLTEKKIKRMCTEDSYKSVLNEELLSYASRMGCKTEVEFTMFLRVRESILAL